MYAKWKKRTQREVAAPGLGDAADDRPVPNFKHNRHVKDEIQSADTIRKAHLYKEDKKLKNMSKDKRSKIMGLQKKKKAQAQAQSQKGKTKAGSRRVKAILRM